MQHLGFACFPIAAVLLLCFRDLVSLSSLYGRIKIKFFPRFPLSLGVSSPYSLSVYRGSWRMYVLPVTAEHNGKSLYYCSLPGTTYDGCLCRSSVTTELVSLQDESARTLGVLDVDESKEKNGLV